MIGKDVTKYEITRNYRSTSILVRHARALIEHNLQRESKNLRSENSAQSRVEVLETSRDTVKNTLLNELFPIVTTCETHFKNTPDLDNSLLQKLTVPQKIGILARNWYEVNPIQTYLKSILEKKGFQVCWSDSDDQEKRKLIMQRGEKEIEVSTIHSAKGREWEKVILLVNTADSRKVDSRKVSLPDERNETEDERRLCYVAVTRAKQELIIFDGGKCLFVPEFQKATPTKEEWEEAFEVELAERESKFKIELEEASKAALAALEFRLKKELEKASKVARKQYESEINHRRREAAKIETEVKEKESDFTKQRKALNDTFLTGLIPVLDEFESRIKGLTETTEINNKLVDLVEPNKSFQLAHKQLLNSLKNNGLRPIETRGEIFNPTYHEEIQPTIYSDNIPAGRIVREKRRGYLLHDRVIRKAEVVVSKGQNIRTSER